MYSTSSAPANDASHLSNARQTDGFFIPAYMRGSRYADSLQRDHKLRSAPTRHLRSNSCSTTDLLYNHPSSQINPYSSSYHSPRHLYSHSHIHKPTSPHRGLNHNVVEHAPRVTDSHHGPHVEPPQPLPTRWNEEDKNSGLELSGRGLEAKLTNHKRANGEEASSVRANHPMPCMAGVYYFEVTVIGHSTRAGHQTTVAIGFCGPTTSLSRLPGWEPNSYAYHSDDGQLYFTKESGRPYGSRFNKGDIVGCGINFRTKTAFFTRNGHNIGVAFRDIRQDKLFPVVGLKNQNEQIRANFGQEPFVFDINAMIQTEKKIVHEEIARADIKILFPPLSERQLIHKLITQYLSNDGYVETANAFAREVQQENQALANIPGLGGSVTMQDVLDPELDKNEDATTRQHIRAAILNGDIESAISLAKEHYPSVLNGHDLIYFRLKCRKFIEMIKLSTLNSPACQTARKSSRQILKTAKTTGFDEMFGQQMELDEHSGVHLPSTYITTKEFMDDLGGPMDTTDAPASALSGPDRVSKSCAPTIGDEDLMAYGTELRSEFMHDSRREVKRELNTTLALMVYHNPTESALKELLADSGRGKLAEDVNSAILISQGKAASAAIEQLVQQTEILLQALGDDGGPGAFYNILSDLLRVQ